MVNINSYMPGSGRIIGEDNKIYNLVDLLQNISSGGGSKMNFLNGTTAPSDDIGVSGDVYLNTTNADLYKKDDAWKKLMNLKGTNGAKGDKGDAGTPGTNGAKGDKGDAGTNGAKGDKGDAGTNGAKGDKGDAGTNGAKGDKGETGTNGERGLEGPAGKDGTNGTPGTNGFGTEVQYNDIITRLKTLEEV